MWLHFFPRQSTWKSMLLSSKTMFTFWTFGYQWLWTRFSNLFILAPFSSWGSLLKKISSRLGSGWTSSFFHLGCFTGKIFINLQYCSKIENGANLIVRLGGCTITLKDKKKKNDFNLWLRQTVFSALSRQIANFFADCFWWKAISRNVCTLFLWIYSVMICMQDLVKHEWMIFHNDCIRNSFVLPSWIDIMCVFRFPACVKVFPHESHL